MPRIIRSFSVSEISGFFNLCNIVRAANSEARFADNWRMSVVYMRIASLAFSVITAAGASEFLGFIKNAINARLSAFRKLIRGIYGDSMVMDLKS